jgi:hypothetical protein
MSSRVWATVAPIVSAKALAKKATSMPLPGVCFVCFSEPEEYTRRNILVAGVYASKGNCYGGDVRVIVPNFKNLLFTFPYRSNV